MVKLFKAVPKSVIFVIALYFVFLASTIILYLTGATHKTLADAPSSLIAAVPPSPTASNTATVAPIVSSQPDSFARKMQDSIPTPGLKAEGLQTDPNKILPQIPATLPTPTATAQTPFEPAQPQPWTATDRPLLLVKLKPAAQTQPGQLLKKLTTLEPVKAGRFQPIDYFTDKNKAEAETLLAVISHRDEAAFANSGLSFGKLDDNADTARYYAIEIPDEAPPRGENWLDSDWQVLDQNGKRFVVKLDLPLFMGFGFRSAKLFIEKIPPYIELPQVIAACPCPALAAATFAFDPIDNQARTKTLPVNQIGEFIAKANIEENLKRPTAQLAANEVPGLGALNTRYTGSVGSIYAAERIFSYFFALGLTVHYDTFQEGGLGSIATNVIAEQAGEIQGDKARPIILIGHYDALGERNLKGISTAKLVAYGANDNALGIVGIMEIARQLMPYKLKQPIRYITFGAEEQGMLGSRHYVYSHMSGTQPKAVMNLDSFGYNQSGEDWNVINYEQRGVLLKEAVMNLEKKYQIGMRLDPRLGEAFYRSDDYYFSKLGFPTVAITDSFNTQSPNNHTPNDTVANINFRTARKVIQLALAVTAELASSDN